MPENQGRHNHNHNHNSPKSFASDATSKRHLMTQQMINLCVFSVLHYVEVAFGAASGGTPKMKMGLLEKGSKMVVVVVGPSLRKA